MHIYFFLFKTVAPSFSFLAAKDMSTSDQITFPLSALDQRLRRLESLDTEEPHVDSTDCRVTLHHRNLLQATGGITMNFEASRQAPQACYFLPIMYMASYCRIKSPKGA
ncbi:predicted protein [Plenodomus lingam JN3]|uniref:Predicted protein n=1 Tax=Leptosphaeria maculans (strain JN3 / isolate v23.1.3 / race Av1-4-5-6-7-8) TaxID=985895 RepID=E4ZJ21_LEPMJ|nr:predicted protein [Plenodomus lingam JN3]CBX91452.1 predicted protein [Plenodomus lingam JN3]